MRCLNPRTVGFMDDGKTISWSQKHFSKEYATFQLPCTKCIECRLEYARQWAVRCVHEASMYQDNAFITLTYSDEHLKSDKLQYVDFQLFMKRLRKTLNEPIGFFVTGEYGEKTKRPHWHAIVFNWTPRDAKPSRVTERGDRVFTSDHLDRLWGKGRTETGTVTFESAGYCARYAAKKLVHGSDECHDYHPISKKSSKHAIGKKFLEKHWKDIFNYGEVHLPDGNMSCIPRYYEKWLKEHQPDAWIEYIDKLKLKRMEDATAREQREEDRYWGQMDRRARFKPALITKNKRRKAVVEAKFKLLQQHLKGDI